MKRLLLNKKVISLINQYFTVRYELHSLVTLQHSLPVLQSHLIHFFLPVSFCHTQKAEPIFSDFFPHTPPRTFS
jgi:hypothetical protein